MDAIPNATMEQQMSHTAVSLRDGTIRARWQTTRSSFAIGNWFQAFLPNNDKSDTASRTEAAGVVQEEEQSFIILSYDQDDRNYFDQDQDSEVVVHYDSDDFDGASLPSSCEINTIYELNISVEKMEWIKRGIDATSRGFQRVGENFKLKFRKLKGEAKEDKKGKETNLEQPTLARANSHAFSQYSLLDGTDLRLDPETQTALTDISRQPPRPPGRGNFDPFANGRFVNPLRAHPVNGTFGGPPVLTPSDLPLNPDPKRNSKSRIGAKLAEIKQKLLGNKPLEYDNGGSDDDADSVIVSNFKNHRDSRTLKKMPPSRTMPSGLWASGERSPDKSVHTSSPPGSQRSRAGSVDSFLMRIANDEKKRNRMACCTNGLESLMLMGRDGQMRSGWYNTEGNDGHVVSDQETSPASGSATQGSITPTPRDNDHSPGRQLDGDDDDINMSDGDLPTTQDNGEHDANSPSEPELPRLHQIEQERNEMSEVELSSPMPSSPPLPTGPSITNGAGARSSFGQAVFNTPTPTPRPRVQLPIARGGRGYGQSAGPSQLPRAIPRARAQVQALASPDVDLNGRPLTILGQDQAGGPAPAGRGRGQPRRGSSSRGREVERRN